MDPMFQEQDEMATPLQIARHVGENEVGNTDCLEPTSFQKILNPHQLYSIKWLKFREIYAFSTFHA